MAEAVGVSPDYGEILEAQLLEAHRLESLGRLAGGVLFGDGGADFNEGAFIVSARENMPVKHLLIDNGGYELVSLNFARDARLRGENEQEQYEAGRVLPLRTQEKVHQNRAFQVRGFVNRTTQEPVFDSAYIELPEQVGPAIAAMLDSKGPFLLQAITQSMHFQPLNK